MVEAPIEAPASTRSRKNPEHCVDCGLWLDSSWRACPTCGRRLEMADAVDSRERLASIISVLGGVIAIVSAFLIWDTIHAPKVDDQVRMGMTAGRGVVPIILGLFAVVLGALAYLHRRWGGNRATLIAVGIFLLGYSIFQRRLINTHLHDLQFKTKETTTSFGPGLWVLALGSIVIIVAGILMPRQIFRGKADEADTEAVTAE